MGRKLYVGDISVSADASELRQVFSTVGTVETINEAGPEAIQDVCRFVIAFAV